MKNLKLKSLLLALGLGFGFISIVNAAPDAISCISFEEACEDGDMSACRIWHRYCL